MPRSARERGTPADAAETMIVMMWEHASLNLPIRPGVMGETRRATAEPSPSTASRAGESDGAAIFRHGCRYNRRNDPGRPRGEHRDRTRRDRRWLAMRSRQWRGHDQSSTPHRERRRADDHSREHPPAPRPEWLNSIYSLVFAALLITLGHVGDRWGRRRLFLTGGRGVHRRQPVPPPAKARCSSVGGSSRNRRGMILPATLSDGERLFVGKDARGLRHLGLDIGGFAPSAR